MSHSDGLADVDIVFAGPIDWEAFGDTPDFFTVGSASWDDDQSRWSAAVMLLNLDNLRTTYDEFIKHVFSEEALANGLLFGTGLRDVIAIDAAI